MIIEGHDGGWRGVKPDGTYTGLYTSYTVVANILHSGVEVQHPLPHIAAAPAAPGNVVNIARFYRPSVTHESRLRATAVRLDGEHSEIA